MRGWGAAGGGWRGLLVLTTLIAACGRDAKDVSADRASGAGASAEETGTSASTSTPLPPPSTPNACPPDGRWHVCSVVKRLEMSGFVPKPEPGAARVAPLQATGTAYTIGRATLTVFLYPDEAARRAEQARLDKAAYLDPYTPVSMQDQATLIGNVNLLAILRSRNDHLRERIGDAFTAGPPQPERGKR